MSAKKMMESLTKDSLDIQVRAFFGKNLRPSFVEPNHLVWYERPHTYVCYAALASIVQPMSVLEIGVFLGYSLSAILKGHPCIEQIVGIDDQSYVPDSQAKALANVLSTGYCGRVELPAFKSLEFFQGFPRLPAFDLAHVDGDHSEEGARHDILEAWLRLRSNGVLVVDDVTLIPHVRAAVESAKSDMPNIGAQFFYPAYNGWWVAVKEAA